MNEIWLAPLLCIVVPALLSYPLGTYMTRAMQGTLPGGIARRTEAFFGHLAGGAVQQHWQRYVATLLISNGLMFVLCAAILACQAVLPLNPDGKGGLSWHLIFHTASSFVSNTNLQHYSGEVSLSHFSQLFALMWLQFFSAGTGIAALAALCRALAGQTQIGNFFIDLLRAVTFLLLPLSLFLAFGLACCGVPMTFDGAIAATTLEGASQLIARGPVVAFVAIKQLGTNGGGFFGPNSTHPFENPTWLSNILECAAIPLIPMACVWMFGCITGRRREARLFFAVMAVLLLAKLALAWTAELAPTAALANLPVPATPNLEGKELRFGSLSGSTWAVLTTSTSNGSVNAMHNSLQPLSVLAALFGMWLNATFGGVGVGFLNFFLYLVVTMFLAGLMVGRTPEIFGRKIEIREMKIAALALLLHPALVLVGTAWFAATDLGTATVANPGFRGFAEILYEFSSASANNGSGLEGLSDNTLPWNLATGIVMLLARYLPIALPLAIAASLAGKRPTPETAGTLPTHSPVFGAVLLASIVIIGALLFLPVAVLGPIGEAMPGSGSTS